MKLTVIQTLPALESGGVERGTVEVALELARRGHRAIVVSAGGRLVGKLEAAGVEHVCLAIGRKSPLTLRLVGPLRRLMLERRADILHTRSRLPGWISYMAWRSLPRGARTHFVTTVHGPYTPNFYSAVMTRGERIIAISEFIREYILRHYRVEPARVRVIPRGVSPAEFPHGFRPSAEWLARWQGEHPGIGERLLLTLPARITRWKGQEDFLELLRLLRERRLDVHGVLVGPAERRREPFLRELQRRSAAFGLEDRVTFTGHRDDIREIMSISAAVLSLAREPEAFGRTALEALSLGVPVVAYDHGGAGEILGRVFPGGLVAPGDVRAAAERVAGFCAARPTVPAEIPFTLQRMLDETLALYAELAGAPAPS